FWPSLNRPGVTYLRGALVSPLSSTSKSRSYAAMSDQFVTITRTSWLGNIMNSFVGVLLGIILFLVAFPVLWFNEGRTNMATVAQASVLVDGTSVSEQTEGKQVAVAGTLAADELLGDPPYLAAGAY